MRTQEGFPYYFDPKACEQCRGNCCRGSGGYIWVEMKELQDIAAFMDISIDSTLENYVRLVGTKLSLQERLVGDEYLCCFFDPVKHRCLIYELRPEQCHTFPFWDKFKEKTYAVMKECPGVKTEKR